MPVLCIIVGRTLPKPPFLGTIQAEHWPEFPAPLQPGALGVGFAAAAPVQRAWSLLWQILISTNCPGTKSSEFCDTEAGKGIEGFC